MSRLPRVIQNLLDRRDKPRNSTPANPRPDAILRTTPETLDETITRDMMPARYRRAEGDTE